MIKRDIVGIFAQAGGISKKVSYVDSPIQKMKIT
jgi:hypothetical protein